MTVLAQLWPLICILVGTVVAEHSLPQRTVRYDGYRLIETGPLTKRRDADLLNDILVDGQTVVSLSNVAKVGNKVFLVASPTASDDLILTLHRRKISFKVVTDNYQEIIDHSDIMNYQYCSGRVKRSAGFDHNCYLSYDEQIMWLSDMALQCGASCSLQFAGPTYEGRDIPVFTINAQNLSLPAIWLDANQEALHWITSATALFIIDQILTGTSPNADHMRRHYRFYIAPNVNPDGYEYSFSADRLWYKNRSVNESEPNCTGVMLSRNFDVSFGEYGSSSNCLDYNYHGPNPFSESESCAIRDFISSIQGNVGAYVTLHSFGQQWVLPWWHTSKQSTDYDQLKTIANAAATASNITNNFSYLTGAPTELNFPLISGVSSDWAKAVVGIRYSYYVNLRPQSIIDGAYDIDPSNIYPNGLEIFNGFTAICREAFYSQP